jgi:hypothetical protein
MNAITVKIGDGEYFAVNDADWPIVASPSLQTPTEHGTATQSLVVRKHQDGRRLIYALVELEGEVLAAAGMLVEPGADLKVPLWRVAAENGLAEWHIKQCEASLAN